MNQKKATLIYFWIFTLILGNWSCNNSITKYEGDILIQNINIIDAKNGLQKEMDIVVKNDKIQMVNPHQKEFSFSGNITIDGNGKFLIPGLWDAHVHFAYLTELAPSMFKLFLVNGVTSVRDTGGKLDLVKPWKDAAEKDPQNSPRVKIAGPLLDGVPVVYDGSGPNRPPLGTGAKNPEEGIKLVDQFFDAQVDLIKAYEMLSPETFAAVAARAKEKGLKVTGHVPLSMDVISASNAGLNSMEHLRNLEMSIAKDADKLLLKRREMLVAGKNDQGGILRSRMHQAQRMHAVQNQDPLKRKEVLSVLAKNNTWQIPTLTIATAGTNAVFARPEWRANYKYLPDSLGNQWMESSIKYAENSPDQNAKDYTKWAEEMVKHLSEANVGIMAGTDCPIFFLTPGYSLHEELRLLVKSGLTSLEAINAATLRPAQYFNLENELGTIENGKLADLLILDENPLDDIRNTQKINAVFKNGKLFDRTALDEMLKDLEEN